MADFQALPSSPGLVPADHHLQEIIAHLGAALMQVGPVDDPIIVEHVRAAHQHAINLNRSPRRAGSDGDE